MCRVPGSVRWCLRPTSSYLPARIAGVGRPSIAAAGTPDTRYSSTSSISDGTSTCTISARLPGVSDAEAGVEAQRARADERRALERSGGPARRGEPPHHLQLREEIQVARRSPDCRSPPPLARPRGRTARSAERPRRPIGCCAGRSRASRPARESARGFPRELHTVDDQRPAVDHAEVIQGTRPARCAAPPSPRARRRSSAASAPIRPCHEASSSISSGGLADVHARPRARRLPRRRRGRPETARARPSTARAAPATP